MFSKGGGIPYVSMCNVYDEQDNNIPGDCAI